MKAKEIAILIIFCLFVLPLLIKTVAWSSNIGDYTPEENTEQAVGLIEAAAVPWWVGILTWLAGLGTLGAILIISFIIFLRWIGEVHG